jgi:hypothetical protein
LEEEEIPENFLNAIKEMIRVLKRRRDIFQTAIENLSRRDSSLL